MRTKIKQQLTGLVKWVKNHQYLSIVIVVAIFGTVLLLAANATTGFVSKEAEDGTPNGTAKIISDNSAASNSAIQFGGSNQFVHPGILVTKPQLEFVKSKVNANQEPWKSAYAKLSSDPKVRKETNYWKAKPVSVLKCSTGIARSYGWVAEGCYNTGSADESNLNWESASAYGRALVWAVTGDQWYADKSIEIMNAWSYTLEEIPYDQPRITCDNNCAGKGQPVYWQNLLEVGWSADTMIRAAEIIKHTNAGWEQADIDQFESMLRNLYYPLIKNYAYGSFGNGGATWAEGILNIGIFLDDRQIYDEGLAYVRSAARSMTYVSRDGTNPIYPYNPLTTALDPAITTPTQLAGIWSGQTHHGRGPMTGPYIQGQNIETCRDLHHTFMGLGGIANGMETAWIQGDDLYGDPDLKDRILSGLELNSNYVNQRIDEMARTGQTAKQVSDSSWKPSGQWVCTNYVDDDGSSRQGKELALNHYKNRLGLGSQLSQTIRLTESERNRKQGAGNHLLWETLTHAENP